MSSPEASPTKGLSTWWKNLKKNTNLSNDSFESNGMHHLHINDVFSSSSQNNSNSNLSRPTLNFKSRSFHSVRRSSGENEQAIRQQRDEFIASQKKFGFGSSDIFGVPLEDSINIAESLISVPCEDPSEFIRYGKIPLLIGKCGSFLKEKGLEVEGIFRIAGASRRVKELQYTFSSPPEYGRKLNWEGYTVHDAASLFRRFLNNLPEPLVPLDLYEEFREPVKSRIRILNHIKARNDTIDRKLRQIQEKKQLLPAGAEISPDEDDEQPAKTEQQKLKEARKTKKISKDIRNALKEYRILIDKLPDAQRHLLFYLLDMLTMFSDSSKYNLMPARNLAAIFQPSILSHPNHDLTPEEYALSQAVVELLIEYSSRLLPNVTSKSKAKSDAAGDETPTSTTSLSKAGSTKNSSANLLAVRNSIKGSRPHSRSLSSANDVPATLTKNSEKPQKDHHSNSDEEDEEDSSDEETYHDTSPVLPNDTPLTTSTATKPIAIPQNNKPTIELKTPTPPFQRKPPQTGEFLSPQQLTPETQPNFTRPRPVSMFPGSLTHHLNPSTSRTSNDDERQSRWFSKSPPSGNDELLSPNTKKGSWFRRLRSSSRHKGE